jgi:hypothetical protein
MIFTMVMSEILLGTNLVAMLLIILIYWERAVTIRMVTSPTSQNKKSEVMNPRRDKITDSVSISSVSILKICVCSSAFV